MKFLITLIILALTPLTYANEQIAKAIKTVSIQGVNFSMDLEQARSILTGNGYKVRSFDAVSKYATFDKEGCSVLIDRSTTKRMLQYNCRVESHNNFVIQFLDELCKKSDDASIRKGCNLDGASAKLNIYEQFTNLEAYKKYKYSAQIGLVPGKSSIQMTADTEYEEIRNSTANITGRLSGIRKDIKIINDQQDSVFIRIDLRDTSRNVADAASCDGVYYVNKTFPKLQPGEAYNDQSINDEVQKYTEKMHDLGSAKETWFGLSNLKMIKGRFGYICLFEDIEDISYSPIDRGVEHVEEVVKNFNIQGVSLFTGIEKARSILMANGFNGAIHPHGGVSVGSDLNLTKEGGLCKFSIASTHQDFSYRGVVSSKNVDSLSYSCPSDGEGSLEIAKLFKELCALDYNGTLKGHRQGCSQPYRGEPSQIHETFEVKTEGQDKHYVVTIKSHKTAPLTFYYSLGIRAIRTNK
ncbi:hypothetical protein [Neptunomonas japonica]|uniref:hypothetical protein n=1 Tax=Neptunomonas japonica TaxID=417574 RepID=UPI0004051C7E|nr:hypothetical protein [Neptunomonas japonica]